jgi:hypothetical protein
MNRYQRKLRFENWRHAFVAFYFGLTYVLFCRRRRIVRVWLEDASSEDCRRYDIMVAAAWNRRPRCVSCETLHPALSRKQLKRVKRLFPLHKVTFYHGYCSTHNH